MTVQAGTAYRKIWRLVNNFFCLHKKADCSEIPIVLSNLLYHYFFHWIMAHFNFVISQNAKWGHAGFYIDRHRMTLLLTCAWLISILWLVLGLPSKIKICVPENILLQKKHCIKLSVWCTLAISPTVHQSLRCSTNAYSFINLYRF